MEVCRRVRIFGRTPSEKHWKNRLKLKSSSFLAEGYIDKGFFRKGISIRNFRKVPKGISLRTLTAKGYDDKGPKRPAAHRLESPILRSNWQTHVFMICLLLLLLLSLLFARRLINTKPSTRGFATVMWSLLLVFVCLLVCLLVCSFVCSFV